MSEERKIEIQVEEESPGSGETSKKKRNVNFSKEEVHCLIAEYGRRLSVLNFGNREQKSVSWDEITTVINNLHPDFKRSVDEVKKKWIDLLYATKKEYIKATKEAELEGTKRRQLSEISELIVKVRGGFSTKCLSAKGDGSGTGTGSMQIINFQIPTSSGDTATPTTIYIPHVEDCHSSGDDEDKTRPNQTGSVVMIPETNIGDFNTAGASVVESIEAYEDNSYTHDTGQQQHFSHTSSRCACGLSADLIRLKQETLGILRRQIQIEEERRLEEKQKWWEQKSLIRLKRQKLELEIKQLQNNIRTTDGANKH